MSTVTVLPRNAPFFCNGASRSSLPRNSTFTRLRSIGSTASARPEASIVLPASNTTLARGEPGCGLDGLARALMLIAPPRATTAAPVTARIELPTISILDCGCGAASTALCSAPCSAVTSVREFSPKLMVPVRSAVGILTRLASFRMIDSLSRANRRIEPLTLTLVVAFARPF